MHRKSLSSLIAVLCLSLCATASAQNIQTKDDLNAYLKSELNTDEYLTTTITKGEEFGTHLYGRDCLDQRSIDKLPVLPRILFRHRAIGLKQAKINRGFVSFGGYACYLQVTYIDRIRAEHLGLLNVSADALDVPLVKREFLGTEGVSLTTTYSGQQKCDISFVPWFRNHSPSSFVQRFRSELAEDFYHKVLLKDEASTDRWCFDRKYDDTIKWTVWYRY